MRSTGLSVFTSAPSLHPLRRYTRRPIKHPADRFRLSVGGSATASTGALPLVRAAQLPRRLTRVTISSNSAALHACPGQRMDRQIEPHAQVALPATCSMGSSHCCRRGLRACTRRGSSGTLANAGTGAAAQRWGRRRRVIKRLLGFSQCLLPRLHLQIGRRCFGLGFHLQSVAQPVGSDPASASACGRSNLWPALSQHRRGDGRRLGRLRPMFPSCGAGVEPLASARRWPLGRLWRAMRTGVEVGQMPARRWPGPLRAPHSMAGTTSGVSTAAGAMADVSTASTRGSLRLRPAGSRCRGLSSVCCHAPLHPSTLSLAATRSAICLKARDWGESGSCDGHRQAANRRRCGCLCAE